MSELSILQAFVAAGMTPVGACAMGGNIQAESGFKSNIAQRGMTEMSDDEYTAAADKYLNFAGDSVGYGLCQWTYPTRKQHLLDYAQSMGASVGDEAMQAEFAILELKHDYPSLWGYLCETQDLSGATGRICTEYERPAVNNIAERARYAHELYMWYGDALMDNGQYTMDNEDAGTGDNKTPLDFAMPVIKRGNASPEARYLADKLAALGYDVLWDGLWAALVDYQGKRGLTVDGVCGAETWKELLNESYE